MRNKNVENVDTVHTHTHTYILQKNKKYSKLM